MRALPLNRIALLICVILLAVSLWLLAANQPSYDTRSFDLPAQLPTNAAPASPR